MVEVFRGVWRVLRDDAVCFVNLGDSYATQGGRGEARMAELGRPTPGAITPSAARGNASGTKTGECLKPKDLCMMPARLALALQADGWVLRSGITWAKGISFCEHYSGSVMPESARDRPTSASEMIWMLAKSNTSQYWTHRDLPGTRTKPKPDYRYVRVTGEEQTEEPEGWKTSKILCPFCEGTKRVEVQIEGDLVGSKIVACPTCKGKKDSMVPEWKRINLWIGHDYYYDQEAAREQQSQSSAERWKGREAGRNLRNVWAIPTRAFAAAHFATFSPDLVEPMVKLGTSEKGCCPECGAPWERVVESGEPDDDQRAACGADSTGGYSGRATKNYAAGGAEDPSAVKARILEGMRKRRTVDWRPTCECRSAVGLGRQEIVDGEKVWVHEPVPATVCDIFAGSGTTLLVAERLGRDSIGIELNPEYAEMARKRIERETRQVDLFAGGK